jgi:hypothetical protein
MVHLERIKGVFGTKNVIALVATAFAYLMYYNQTGAIGSPFIGNLGGNILMAIVKATPFVGSFFGSILAVVFLVVDFVICRLIVGLILHFFVK